MPVRTPERHRPAVRGLLPLQRRRRGRPPGVGALRPGDVRRPRAGHGAADPVGGVAGPSPAAHPAPAGGAAALGHRGHRRRAAAHRHRPPRRRGAGPRRRRVLARRGGPRGRGGRRRRDRAAPRQRAGARGGAGAALAARRDLPAEPHRVRSRVGAQRPDGAGRVAGHRHDARRSTGRSPGSTATRPGCSTARRRRACATSSPTPGRPTSTCASTCRRTATAARPCWRSPTTAAGSRATRSRRARATSGCKGLAGLAATMGASLMLDTTPGRGTTLRLEVPVR